MRFLILLLMMLVGSDCLSENSNSTAESLLDSYDDYMIIQQFPSRSAFFKMEPTYQLRANFRTSVKKRDGTVYRYNEILKSFYRKIKTISLKGVTSNQQRFHVPIESIQIQYAGKLIKLDFAGKSDNEKYSIYENDYLMLRSEIYDYLSAGISPNNSIKQTQ